MDFDQSVQMFQLWIPLCHIQIIGRGLGVKVDEDQDTLWEGLSDDLLMRGIALCF